MGKALEGKVDNVQDQMECQQKDGNSKKGEKGNATYEKVLEMKTAFDECHQ